MNAGDRREGGGFYSCFLGVGFLYITTILPPTQEAVKDKLGQFKGKDKGGT